MKLDEDSKCLSGMQVVFHHRRPQRPPALTVVAWFPRSEEREPRRNLLSRNEKRERFSKNQNEERIARIEMRAR
jgi:hypothetical protein